MLLSIRNHLNAFRQVGYHTSSQGRKASACSTMKSGVLLTYQSQTIDRVRVTTDPMMFSWIGTRVLGVREGLYRR